MAVVGALIDFLAAGLTDPDTGSVYSGALVGYYIPGTATGKAVWSDRGKTAPAAGAGETTSTLDSNGQIVRFGDGLYDIKVFDPEDTGLTTPRMTFSSVNIVDGAVGSTLTDPSFLDGTDGTKIAAMDMSSITTATTRTFTWPDFTTTLVGTDATQTLTNKTLTSPTLTTPTLTSPVINTGVSGTAIIDDDTGATVSNTTLWVGESIKAYVDAHAIVQELVLEDSTGASGATAFPIDNTIPQITEGNLFMTLAITPTVATNIIVVDVVGFIGAGAVAGSALFNPNVHATNALAVSETNTHTNGYPQPHILRYSALASALNGTGVTTFTFRAGIAAGATTYFNNSAGVNPFLGLDTTSYIKITEYNPAVLTIS